MPDFVTLLLENLPEIFSFGVALASFLLVWYKTKSFNIAINSYKEVLTEMKKDPRSYAQDFTGANLKTQYRYNAEKNILEELPTKIDLQAQIDSHIETCLERVLERFLPTADPTALEVVTTQKKLSKLDEMLALTEKANEYRQAFNLSDDLSIQEVFNAVSNKAEALKLQLSNFNKEDILNEKTNDIEKL